jgi:type II secretory pathway component GspD/PulD (secretin)
MVTLAPATSTTVAVQIPEINNQETQTRVMVENGKTLVIAGLISDNKVVAKNKVPVLGDIPWLGKLLFTSSNTTVTRTELLIFLTPHVITVDKKPAPGVVQ